MLQKPDFQVKIKSNIWLQQRCTQPSKSLDYHLILGNSTN